MQDDTIDVREGKRHIMPRKEERKKERKKARQDRKAKKIGKISANTKAIGHMIAR